MKEKVTRAQLCLEGPGGFIYDIATIRYIVRDDESFQYEIEPNYAVIDLLGPQDFQGIPGVNLSLRKPIYVRENTTPTLIADRAPMDNREDLWQLLEAYGMDYLDPVEWLVRSQKRYIGDKFFFRAIEDNREAARIDIGSAIERAPSTHQAIKRILTAICAGTTLECDGVRIGSDIRKVLFRTLLRLYEKGRKLKSGDDTDGHPSVSGRKRKPVDELMLREAIEQYRAHRITAKEAAETLDIGVATFYRRMAECKDELERSKE